MITFLQFLKIWPSLRLMRHLQQPRLHLLHLQFNKVFQLGGPLLRSIKQLGIWSLMPTRHLLRGSSGCNRRKPRIEVVVESGGHRWELRIPSRSSCPTIFVRLGQEKASVLFWCSTQGTTEFRALIRVSSLMRSWSMQMLRSRCCQIVHWFDHRPPGITWTSLWWRLWTGSKWQWSDQWPHMVMCHVVLGMGRPPTCSSTRPFNRSDGRSCTKKALRGSTWRWRWKVSSYCTLSSEDIGPIVTWRSKWTIWWIIWCGSYKRWPLFPHSLSPCSKGGAWWCALGR